MGRTNLSVLLYSKDNKASKLIIRYNVSFIFSIVLSPFCYGIIGYIFWIIHYFRFPFFFVSFILSVPRFRLHIGQSLPRKTFAGAAYHSFPHLLQ